MLRIRLAGIVPMNGGYALMHRKDVKNKPLSEYYVFPGGGLEENDESLENNIKDIAEAFYGEEKQINYDR